MCNCFFSVSAMHDRINESRIHCTASQVFCIFAVHLNCIYVITRRRSIFCLVTHRSSSKQLDKSMYSMAAQLAKFAPISSRSNIQLHWTHPTLTLIDFRSIKFSISLTLWAMSNECSQHIHSFYAIHFFSHHDMMVCNKTFSFISISCVCECENHSMIDDRMCYKWKRARI